MKYFFVDTNLFLQCKDVNNIPWETVSNSEPIELIIPRAVQIEIDKLKSDGNGRRAKRARAANSYFRQIVLSEGERLEVCNSPSVTITFSSVAVIPSRGNSSITSLDPDRADDSILIELIAYRTAHPNQDVSLLTHDINPVLTAKRLEIPFQVIPDEWLLAPEPDERDKELRQLKMRNEELEKRTPQIKINLEGATENQPQKIQATIIQFSEPSNLEAEKLLEHVKNQFPMKTNFEEKPSSSFEQLTAVQANIFGRSKYIPPLESEIVRYRDVEYPEWLEKVREKLCELPEYLNQRENVIKVSLSLSNDGNVPAEHVIFRIEVPNGFVIVPPKHDDEPSDSWSFPPPPAAPKGRYEEHPILGLSRMFAESHTIPISPSSFHGISKPHVRDRNSFYHKYGRPTLPGTLREFDCEEFLHKDEPEVFQFEIAIVGGNGHTNGKLKCSLMGKNIPSPTVVEIPLMVSLLNGDFLQKAIGYIKPPRIRLP